MESSRLPTRPARHSLRRVRFHTCPEVDHIFARAPCVSTFCRVWHRWFPELWGFFVPTLEQTLQSKQHLHSVTDLSTSIFVASSVCQKLFDGSQVAVSHCKEGSSRSDQLVRGPITSRGSRDWDRGVLHCCVVLGFTLMCGTTIPLPVHYKDPPIHLAVPCRSVSRFCVVLDRSRTHVPRLAGHGSHLDIFWTVEKLSVGCHLGYLLRWRIVFVGGRSGTATWVGELEARFVEICQSDELLVDSIPHSETPCCSRIPRKWFPDALTGRKLICDQRS